MTEAGTEPAGVVKVEPYPNQVFEAWLGEEYPDGTEFEMRITAANFAQPSDWSTPAVFSCIPVPEPSLAAGLVAGALLLAILKRRRKP